MTITQQLNNPIGYQFKLGWNGAKQLGDTAKAYQEVRIEAVGTDWMVIRTEEGTALTEDWAGGFHWPIELMIKELQQ